MLIYSLMLVPLTMMPVLFGAFGWLYAVAAVSLGAPMVWYCVRLLRERGVTPTAWKLYRYSLLYLALLFLAMAVDRNLPGAEIRPDRVMILRHPEPGPFAPADHSGMH